MSRDLPDPNQQMRFDLANAEIIDKDSHLLRVNQIPIFRKFQAMLKRGEKLTSMQSNFLEGMYETVISKKFKTEKCNVHVDLKHKSKTNLRY